MGLLLLGCTSVAAAAVAFGFVRWFLRRAQVVDPRHSTRIACLSTVLCLGAFAAAFVVILMLLAATSDTAGDAALHALYHGARWLRDTLRP